MPKQSHERRVVMQYSRLSTGACHKFLSNPTQRFRAPVYWSSPVRCGWATPTPARGLFLMLTLRGMMQKERSE